MSARDQGPFCIEEIATPYDGFEAYAVRFSSTLIPGRCPPSCWCSREDSRPEARAALGRAVVFDPERFDLRIYPFYELIHRTWLPGSRSFVRFGPNLGTSVYDFIHNSGGPELRAAMELRVKRVERAERAERISAELKRCVFACNTLQTNFVRGNGFVIAPPDPDPGAEASEREPILICRPTDAPGMYDDRYEKLEGNYDVIVLACEQRGPAVKSFRIANNKWQELPLPGLAICSPRVLECGRPVAARDIPYRDNKVDQTLGNQVNWHPARTYTSFTAFGVRADGKIIAVSMFEGACLGDISRNRGVMATEMGCLLQQLGATDGVIGGGAADTQQFLDADCGDLPALMLAPPRAKRPEETATREVEGPRGLGAIFALLRK